MVLFSMCIVIVRYCSSFLSYLIYILMEKGYIFVYKINFIYKGFYNILFFIKICFRRYGGFKCVIVLIFVNKIILKIFW